MTPLGTITVPASPWAWPAGVCLAAALVLLVWSHRRAGRLRGSEARVGRTQKIAFALKLIGLSLLALCLVEPLWTGRRAKSGANLFAVVADNSSGMNIRDRDATRSRGEFLQDILRRNWPTTLAQNFQVRRYLFDSRLRRTADFAELAFDGRDTALGATLRTLAERYAGRPLAGILLLTDGCATDMGEPWPDLAGLPPVYPVAIGRGGPQQDLAVANVSVSQTAFEDAPVTIQADVEATGFAGQTVTVDLLEESGSLVERQHWRVDTDEAQDVFRFRLRPDKTGVLFYRLRVAEASPGEASPGSAVSSEATQANNERTAVVNRGTGPYRVLYVAGRPNWEYKFLQRAISEDEQVQLVALLRVARREPKYDWRGRSGETGNPLYRGFDARDQDEAGQYDRPVLVRLNTRDEAELRDGFPKTKEELFDYHAVILDDVEAAFFTRDQMDLLRRFVVERGGGFLMLGGPGSFQHGGYQRTPIGGMLPVYLDPVPADPTLTEAHLSLTREGWLLPWARLRDNETDEQERLAAMSEFRVLNPLRLVKPGARIIAVLGADGGGASGSLPTARVTGKQAYAPRARPAAAPQNADARQPSPALVVQRLGNGRTAALAVGDIWRWGLRQPEHHEDMDKFWRQMLRWLVTDTPERISLQAVLQPNATNQAVTLRIQARDKAFEPLDNVSLVVEVQETEGGTVRPAAAPVPTESGVFEATYVPRSSGGYRVKVVASDAGGKPLGEAQTGWAADLEAREFQSVRANRPLLEKLARQTGGRMVEAGALEDFARTLPRRDAPVTETWVRPWWDLPGFGPGLFLLALVCLVGEWALRRWKGLP
jgi:hypothetical protein